MMNRGKIRGKSLNDLPRNMLHALKTIVSAFHPLTLTGFICVVAYVLCCAILGLRLRQDLEDGINKHTLAMHIASLFTGMSVPISCYLIYDHLSHFYQPKLQIQVIRIILIVPVFAFESSLSIHFIDYAFYFQVVREFYESYVIYSFMRFLLYYLGDTEKIVQSLVTKPPSFGIHKQPFCCISTWTMGEQFLAGCKTGVLQYVLNRFVLTSMSVLLHALGLYVEGDYSLDSPYLYLTIINSLSQTYALYALFLFYYASSAEFKSIRPFEKFLSIKLIIFFSWWQGIIIGFLVSGAQIENNKFNYDASNTPNTFTGALDGGLSFARKINSGMSADQHATQHLADGIQDLLICMEMLFAAIAFTYSFPVADFIVGNHDATQERRDTPGGSMPSLYTSTPAGISGIRRRGGPVSHEHENISGISGALLRHVSSSYDRKLSSPAVDDEDETDDDEGDAMQQRIRMLAQEGPAGDRKYTHTPVRRLHLPQILQTTSQFVLPSPQDEDCSTVTSDTSSQQLSKRTPPGSPHHREQQAVKEGVRKSPSVGSLCSRGSSDSSRSQSKGHSRRHSQLSPRKLPGSGSKHQSRRYNWKDISSNSLYTQSYAMNIKSADGSSEQEATGVIARTLLQRLCSMFLLYADTCLVCTSSIAFFLSSFFFKDLDTGFPQDSGSDVEDPSSLPACEQMVVDGDKYHRTDASTDITNALFMKNTTPKKYYDYHYYHAAPVHEQLQQTGRFTVLQAIYLTLVMGDLKGDMLELLMHLLDILIINPSIQLKRWIKSNAA